MMGAGKELVLEIPRRRHSSAEEVDLLLVVMDEAAVEVVLVLGELRFCEGEIDFELAELVLEERDHADAAVDGVSEPHISFVRQ